jgi:hypothetical protein
MRAVFYVCVSLLLVSCVKPEETAPKPAPVVVETAPADPTTPTAPPEKATPEAAVTPKETPAALPANATPTATPKAKTAKESFVACGCGCCGGLDDVKRETSCLYHAKGDSMEAIKKADADAAKAEQCKFAGCSLGTKYEFCD